MLSINKSRAIFDFEIPTIGWLYSKDSPLRSGIDLKQVIKIMKQYFEDLGYENITTITKNFGDKATRYSIGTEWKVVTIKFDLPKSKSKKPKKIKKKQLSCKAVVGKEEKNEKVV